MLQTFKTIYTVNGSKLSAAIVNAVAYGFYAIVVIYMMCDLPILTKAFIVGLCNLVGVYVVKYIEEKRAKDKLWKAEFTVKGDHTKVTEALEQSQVPFNYVILSDKYTMYNAYCATKEETDKIKNIIDQFDAKYFVSESKIQ